MIRFMYASEKTNSFRPMPWRFTNDPFPAIRGQGQRYSAFLAVARDFVPRLYEQYVSDPRCLCVNHCKIITTKKGGLLLVPCAKEQDEQIMLITARGGFRGQFGCIKAHGAEILYERSMNMHCCPVAHIVARVKEPEGYVITETGRRCATGHIDVFSWKGGYFQMSSNEYEVALETGYLFYKRDFIAEDIKRVKDLEREFQEKTP